MFLEIYEERKMVDVEELKGYFKKLKKAVDTADMAIFGKKLVKKNRIDDLLCCIFATLPDTFKVAMKKRLNADMYPAVASYNRLSQIIKKPFFLSHDFYIFDESEALVLLQNISKNLERDINRLEEESQI
jgi:hypothetical protein